jgi:hypothetical protein
VFFNDYPGLEPIENAIVQYFKANPSGPDGHNVRTIFDGTKRIAPESMSGPRSEQVQTLVYVILFACGITSEMEG